MDEQTATLNETQSNQDHGELSKYAPRLASATKTHARNFKIGLTAVPLLLAPLYLGLEEAGIIIGVLGLLAYWGAYFKISGEIENQTADKQDEIEEKGKTRDIPLTKSIWFKFGPALSYIGFFIAIFFLMIRWMWRNQR